MKIYYNPTNGNPIRFVFDTDTYKSIPPDLPFVEVDEIPSNKDSIRELISTFFAEDIDGNKKYYIENGQFILRPNWEPV